MTIYWNNAVRKSGAVPMSEAEWQARVQLAGCYRVFDMLGWTEMIFNHITLRVPGPEDQRHFLINPFGLHYSEITASNLVLIDAEGNPLRESPHPVNRAGFVIHSAIHGCVAEAHCVMHTHTTSGMAVACSEHVLLPHSFYAAQLHGCIAYHEFEGITVDLAEQDRMIADIGNRHAVILRNHGLLTWDATLPQAFMWLWTLQRACDVQVATLGMGAMHPIREPVFEQTVRESGPGEKRVTEDVFAAMLRLVEAKDPSFRS